MTDIERLSRRLQQMRRNGMKQFNIFWGDEAHLLQPEQRARYVNRLLDSMEAGEFTPVTDAEMDAWDAAPEKVNVDELVDRLNGEKCDPDDLEAISV